jgi:hypothetical protein
MSPKRDRKPKTPEEIEEMRLRWWPIDSTSLVSMLEDDGTFYATFLIQHTDGPATEEQWTVGVYDLYQFMKGER